MAGQTIGSIDTTAIGALHDMQLDYYGRRAAAAGANGMIYVYDITDGQQPQLTGQLPKAHDAPVWKVCWAHPKYGSVLASCSYDMKVIIWKEARPNDWQIAYMDTSHAASVNDIEFCSWELGLRLACASSDGCVSVLTYGANHQWSRSVFTAHPGGACAVSWAPYAAPPASQEGATPTLRLATGGNDHAVYVWKCSVGPEGEMWAKDSPPFPAQHSDAVRDIAWRPDAPSTLATGSWDKMVTMWTQDMEGQSWRQVCQLTMAGKVESLSWSPTGGIIAISFGEAESSLYKEAYNGKFEEIGKVNEPGFQEVPNSIMSAIATQGSAAEAPVVAAVVAPVAAVPQIPDAAAQQQQEQQAAVLAAFGGVM